MTGLQDEKHPNEGQIKPDPVKEERCASCGKSCSHGDEEDPIFQQFLMDMESDFVTPTEEQKKLLRYVSDWKHWNWNHQKDFGYVTLEELYAFIGLMYYRGMMDLNKTHLDRLFGGKDNVPMFGATMTQIRFMN